MIKNVQRSHVTCFNFSLLISCYKWLLPVFPSVQYLCMTLLEDIESVTVFDEEMRRMRMSWRRVWTCDRHGWAVSVVMATQKCTYRSASWDEVTANHSLHIIGFSAHHPLFLLSNFVHILPFFASHFLSHPPLLQQTVMHQSWTLI